MDMMRDDELVELNTLVRFIVEWYEANARELPWRTDRDPYHIWVSEIMLQQTRIEAVIPYYARFMERLPDIKSLASCDDEELHKLWEGLGYYSRVRNLKKAAQMICERYDGVFPEDYEAIRSLPGIGDYTAGAIASMAFGQPRAAVDGNVLRVWSRIMACDSDVMDQKYRKEVTESLNALYPPGHESSLTQGLMELGEVICIPNGAPDCEHCPVAVGCKAYHTGTQMDYPVRTAKPQRRIVEMTVLRLLNREGILLHRRSEEGLLAGLWEYPNFAGKIPEEQILTQITEAGLLDGQLESLCYIGKKKHIFTHIEWHMHCYEAVCEGELSHAPDYAIATEDKLRTVYALPTAFRKLWK